MSKKSVLILNRTSPYGSSKPREALDIALTCSIFEMPVSLLFLDDGVLQLVKNQKPEALGQKNLESILSSLPMYDIENLYVSEEALLIHALTEEDLSLPVAVLNSDQIADQINNHNTVLTF